LQICVFTISDDIITRSLLTAHDKGIRIKIITDNDKSLDVGSDIEQLAKAGISVRMDTSPNHMHHKFMVTDKNALITGSYNWTVSAARYNHENILLTREPGVIKTFSRQFDQLWDVMEPYS
jgi:phosphatidylserine/phosphatidylglycerophosphate/cardiolipin synthase-like enzyme